MDATGDYHTKWSKSERERQIPYHLYQMEPKIQHKSAYLQNRNRLTDIENRLMVAKAEGRGERWIGNLGWVDANYYIY